MVFADFLFLSSEEWKTLLLAVIALYMEWLRRKSNAAADAAKDAKVEATTTKKLLNGRMDELLKEAREKAYAEGHKAGVAAASQTIGSNPNIPVEGQEIAKAVASALTATPEKK